MGQTAPITFLLRDADMLARSWES